MYGLTEISGMGYRKALEFLIKDYAILRWPDDAEVIRKMTLGNCINEKIGYDRLKTLAQRAVWLGNDFTHYERRFEDFEIEDLKRFIDAALFWIEAELTTDEAEQLDSRR